MFACKCCTRVRPEEERSEPASEWCKRCVGTTLAEQRRELTDHRQPRQVIKVGEYTREVV